VWKPKPKEKKANDLEDDENMFDNLINSKPRDYRHMLLVKPATDPDVLASIYPKAPSDKIVSLLKILFTTALQFETDASINCNSNLQEAALLGPVAMLLEEDYQVYFEALDLLPYDSSRSLRSLLDYLSANTENKKRWQPMLLKMGLMLANPYARMAWYILHSSLLYTWECITKFRRADKSKCSIFYKDLPSFKSGPTSVTLHKE
jgi:hypothetical protein